MTRHSIEGVIRFMRSAPGDMPCTCCPPDTGHIFGRLVDWEEWDTGHAPNRRSTDLLVVNHLLTNSTEGKRLRVTVEVLEDAAAATTAPAGAPPTIAPRWCAVSSFGAATRCTSEEHARKLAAQLDKDWPDGAPHTAVLLAPVNPDTEDAKARLDESLTQALEERDRAEGWADGLAQQIGRYFNENIGEHSNLHCPWEAAREIIENAPPFADTNAEDGPAQAPAIELQGIAETLKEGGGFWRSCSGCHELNEGVPTGPYSDTLKCHLGGGCGECGGIGAVWDTTDYQAMADAMASALSSDSLCWHVSSRTGAITRCANAQHAKQRAAQLDQQFPDGAPHIPLLMALDQADQIRRLFADMAQAIAERPRAVGVVCGQTPGESKVELKLLPAQPLGQWLDLGMSVDIAAPRQKPHQKPDQRPGQRATALDVDALAQEIRRVDGKHDLGAGALAQALMPFLSAYLPGSGKGEAS